MPQNTVEQTPLPGEMIRISRKERNDSASDPVVSLANIVTVLKGAISVAEIDSLNGMAAITTSMVNLQ